MRLIECPQCSKSLNPPFKTSKRQVCTGCGWASKKATKKKQLHLEKYLIFLIVGIISVVAVKIKMHLDYQDYIEGKLLYREEFLDRELLLHDHEYNYGVYRKRREAEILEKATEIFRKNISVGDKFVLEDNLHRIGTVIGNPNEEDGEIVLNEVKVKFDDSEYRFGISPEEFIIIDSSTRDFILTVEDFKEEASKEVEKIRKKEQAINLEYIKILDEMVSNFSLGNTVVNKNNPEIKGIVREINKRLGFVKVQWEESSFTGYEKLEDLKIIDPNTNIILWQPPSISIP